MDNFSVKCDAHGNWTVTLNNKYVHDNQYSLKELPDNLDPETKEINEKKKWLLGLIERHDTLERVAQAIVDHQSEFLDRGPDHIVPLTMYQVADDANVDVTMILGAVTGKSIQTPHGIFALEQFFGSGTQTAKGEDIAWLENTLDTLKGIVDSVVCEKIGDKLKEIVDSEDKSKPFSDDALVEELAKHGFKLARRAVTIYRIAMDIPSPLFRREY